MSEEVIKQINHNCVFNLSDKISNTLEKEFLSITGNKKTLAEIEIAQEEGDKETQKKLQAEFDESMEKYIDEYLTNYMYELKSHLFGINRVEKVMGNG